MPLPLYTPLFWGFMEGLRGNMGRWEAHLRMDEVRKTERWYWACLLLKWYDESILESNLELERALLKFPESVSKPNPTCNWRAIRAKSLCVLFRYNSAFFVQTLGWSHPTSYNFLKVEHLIYWDLDCIKLCLQHRYASLRCVESNSLRSFDRWFL